MLELLKSALEVSVEAHTTPRRQFMLGSLAPALAAATAVAGETAIAAQLPGQPIRSEFMSFKSEDEEFKAHFRFERDLVERGETLTWYHFLVFMIADGQRPQPIVRFEGMEYSYFQRLKPLTYRIHAHNLSFPRDLTTGQFVAQARNPITGEMIDVPPTILTEDPGVIDSPKGYLTLDSKTPTPTKTYSFYRIEGDLVRREHIRAAPADWPMPFIETSTVWTDLSTFEDKAITSLPMHTSGLYVAPWPRWMKMGERKGHMLGSWTGRKLGSISELPREFRAKAEKDRPDLLSARWSEFDRPLPFTL